MKRKSPFQINFWKEKGLTEEEASFKVKTMRSINKEYWINKGFNEEEALLKVKEVQSKNSKKINEKYSKEEIRSFSKRCKEYWINKGFNEEEALLKVKEVQSNFSLEKCIEKYGSINGLVIWSDRQVKWQDTLNKKNLEEKELINSKKSYTRLELYDSINTCIEKLSKRNITLYTTLEEFVENEIDSNTINRYIPYSYFIEHRIKNVQKKIFDELGIEYKEKLKEILNTEFNEKYIIFIDKAKKQSYKMRTEEGLLRSSFEIYFYEEFKKKSSEKIYIGERYPDSNFRYDFKIRETYIEICPNYKEKDKDEYSFKMDKKQKLFNCLLLKNKEDIDNFIKNFGE